MRVIRQVLAPLVLLILTVALVILGFASSQTGLVGIALLCVWPMLFAAAGWTFRGLRDTYQIVPKNRQKRQQEVLG